MTLNKLKALLAQKHLTTPEVDAILDSIPDIAADYEAMKTALTKMLSEETDWENGAVGVGNVFRLIARETLRNLRCKDAP